MYTPPKDQIRTWKYRPSQKERIVSHHFSGGEMKFRCQGWEGYLFTWCLLLLKVPAIKCPALVGQKTKVRILSQTNSAFVETYSLYIFRQFPQRLKINLSPENWWLELELEDFQFPFWNAPFTKSRQKSWNFWGELGSPIYLPQMGGSKTNWAVLKIFVGCFFGRKKYHPLILRGLFF